MALSKNEIENLIRLIGRTRDDEINCDKCLANLAEFAERQLAGKSVTESLQAVVHHLSICEECRDEYEALEHVLKDAGQ